MEPISSLSLCIQGDSTGCMQNVILSTIETAIDFGVNYAAGKRFVQTRDEHGQLVPSNRGIAIAITAQKIGNGALATVNDLLFSNADSDYIDKYQLLKFCEPIINETEVTGVCLMNPNEIPQEFKEECSKDEIKNICEELIPLADQGYLVSLNDVSYKEKEKPSIAYLQNSVVPLISRVTKFLGHPVATSQIYTMNTITTIAWIPIQLGRYAIDLFL